ncbi:hypothetical protein KY290_034463 [Solanum tuberosum]|uniref:Uncharacterized protein n=1 Tax=Solanum tuberosum TaxID=4113 RepID=A0ABQ7U3N1_SOLTU|nr:hypothetical protein KY290_034463 [Solanum tuberosum]
MFKSLANLKYLNISRYYNLKELSTGLASLNALKSLQIESCDALESLPKKELEGLTSLSELFVHNCKMWIAHLLCGRKSIDRTTLNLSLLMCFSFVFLLVVFEVCFASFRVTPAYFGPNKWYQSHDSMMEPG